MSRSPERKDAAGRSRTPASPATAAAEDAARMWETRIDQGRQHWRTAVALWDPQQTLAPPEAQRVHTALVYAQLFFEAALRRIDWAAAVDEPLLPWALRRFETLEALALVLYLRDDVRRCVETVNEACVTLADISRIDPRQRVCADNLRLLMSVLYETETAADDGDPDADDGTPLVLADDDDDDDAPPEPAPGILGRAAATHWDDHDDWGDHPPAPDPLSLYAAVGRLRVHMVRAHAAESEPPAVGADPSL